MKIQRSCLLLVLGGFTISNANAVTPRSTDYSFEYSAVGMGGGTSASNDYEMVGYMDDSGSASPAASTDYSVQPAVGAVEPNAAAVNAWALY